MSHASDPRLEILEEAAEILETLGIPYWICNGTLLGLVRDATLIPWDVDIDLGVDRDEDLEVVTKTFVQNGYEIHDDGPGSDYIVFIKNGTRLDLNLFSPDGANLQTLWRVPKREGWERIFIAILRRLRLPIPRCQRFWVLEGYAVPSEAVYPLRKMTFGKLTLLAPIAPEEVLEFTYGNHWRVPNPDYDWRRDGENNAHG